MAMPSMSESFANALGTYVHEPDASFAWKRTEHKKIKGATLTHLELISQTWRGNFWSHDLLIVRPTTLRQADIAMLFIADDGYDARDEKEADRFHEVAQRAGAIVAILSKVPNQPLYDGRKEDALIAFTFDQYLKTRDPTWPLLFPMVKSAVRAMDTLQTFARAGIRPNDRALRRVRRVQTRLDELVDCCGGQSRCRHCAYGHRHVEHEGTARLDGEDVRPAER